MNPDRWITLQVELGDVLVQNENPFREVQPWDVEEAISAYEHALTGVVDAIKPIKKPGYICWSYLN